MTASEPSSRSGPLPPDHRVSRLAKVLTIVVLTLVLLGAAELVARIFYRGSPALLVRDPLGGGPNLDWPRFFRKHPELFWELRRNVDEPLSHMGDRTNSRGFRNREDPSPRPSKLRVLCLGASCTYAMGVSIDDAWSSLLARISGYDVVNAGVPGYSSYQGRLLYEDRCRDLDADVHVIEFGLSDYVTWPSMVNGVPMALTDRERARHLRYSTYRSHSRVLDWLQSLTLPAPGDLQGVDAVVSRPRVTIDEFRENLAYLASEAPAAVLLVWPIRSQIDPDFPSRSPLEKYVAYQEVIRGFANQGHEIVEVEEAFRQSGLEPGKLYADAVHASAAGCRLIAEAVHQAILRRLARGAAPEKR